MSKCNVCDCYVTLILVLKFSHFVMCKSSCAHLTRRFSNCTSLLGRISLQVINHFIFIGQRFQTRRPPQHRIWQRCSLRTFSKRPPRQPFFAARLCVIVFCYERWRSLSVLASPTSLFSSWAPNYCWHGQEPGYNFHRTRVYRKPRKQNRLWPLWPSGPLHHSLACPETPSLARPAGLSCSRPGSRTVKGEGKGREIKASSPLSPVCSSSSATATQGNAPAVGTESGHSQLFRARMVVDALRRGETRRHPQAL